MTIFIFSIIQNQQLSPYMYDMISHITMHSIAIILFLIIIYFIFRNGFFLFKEIFNIIKRKEV